ncbi:helix-turn-helix domain-containing protein [Streptomyces sp. NBC_00576]|uniref:helix-turn-helix domain-containing protein n=1 Tax=Streptomyces sp. NBC_00576 TaxID=2903665 RepID=UPI002E815DD0|nr:helix-turn-helix transcriptional regulator [Streptomyces sp. NBC_00576]WUB71995.1 helix-turn-helix domain-containing protein [Streptomyces sp. NBC_00576]
MTSGKHLLGAFTVKSPLVQQPTFGERLRELRKARSLSQRDLARERITPSYISLMESGRRAPTLDVLVQLSAVLEVSLETLVGSPLELPELTQSESAPRDAGVVSLAPGLDGPVVDTLLLQGGAEGMAPTVYRSRLETLYQELLAGPPSWALVQVALQLAQVLSDSGDAEARYDVLTTVAAILKDANSPGIRLRTYIDLASAARDTGNLAAARSALAVARAELLPSGLMNSSEHVRLLSVEVSVRCEAGEDLSELLLLIDELLAVTTHVDSLAVQGRAHWAIGTMYARYDKVQESVPYLLAARGMLSNANLPVHEWLRFCTSLAALLIDLGAEPETAKQHLDAAWAVTEASGWVPHRALLRAKALHLLDSGAPAEAEEVCRRAIDEGGPPEGMDHARLYVTWGRALAALDRGVEAAERVRTAALYFEEMGHLRLAVDCWRWLDKNGPARGRP